VWHETKQTQLNALHQHQAAETLANEERSLVDRLLNGLEQGVWERLGPGLRGFHTEQAEPRESCGQLQTQNALLAVLVARQENLLARGRVQRAELSSEHEVLKAEYEHITGNRRRGRHKSAAWISRNVVMLSVACTGNVAATALCMKKKPHAAPPP
jgi:hypothetical protein